MTCPSPSTKKYMVHSDFQSDAMSCVRRKWGEDLMKNTSKYQRKIRISQMISSILTAVIVFFMPFVMDGTRTFGIGLLYTIVMGTGFKVDYLLFMICLVLSVLHIVRLIFLIRRKTIRKLYRLETATFLLMIFSPPILAVVLASDFRPGGSVLLVPLLLILSMIEFLYCRYQETMEDQEEELRQAREREREEKKHRKKADYFPGKYPKEFYRVIRKMFRARLKVQVLMMLSEAFAAAYLFIVLSMYGIMKDTYEMESAVAGDGLYGLFRSLGLILTVLSIVMMVMMTAWYMKEVKKDFRMLVIFGIRRRTAYTQFLLEFWMGALISALVGLGAGALGASVLRAQLQKGILNGMIFPQIVTGKYIGMGILAYLILMALSLALNQENFIDLGRSVDRNEDLQKENRLRRWISLWIIGGSFLIVLAVAWYSVREWAESRFIHVLTVLGIFFLLSGGMAWWLRSREKKEIYYARLNRTNLFYHRFWSNTQRLFFLTVIQFLSMSMFAGAFAGAWMPQKIETMYPYDIVVTAYEAELPELEKIAEKYDADVQKYPMIRMTSVYGSDEIKPPRRPTKSIQWPQGQQIAISENTYQKMREVTGKETKDLDLSGEEMHVVYQQDLSVKAHTIDWDTGRIEKHLRFGQPLEYYDPDDFRNVFPVRTIKSEERDSLIGSFHQGMQDNLVVLSDSYFQENYDRITAYNRKNWETRQMITKEEWRMYTVRHTENLTEGPTTLFCMNLDEGMLNEALSDLEYLNEEQDFDTVWDSNIQPFYMKDKMIVNTESEIFFTKIANGFIILILLILGLFQYFVKVKSEEDTWRWENTFLKRLGMHEKERKNKISYQMKFFILVPLMFGMIGGMTFGGLTAKARLYTEKEMIQFAGCMAAIYLLWILFWVLVYLMLRRNVWNYVEKE